MTSSSSSAQRSQNVSPKPNLAAELIETIEFKNSWDF